MADEHLRQLVTRVTQCTRALTQAHFDTSQPQPDMADAGIRSIARGRKFIGADSRALEARKASNGVTEADWKTYVSVWKRTQGPSLEVSSEPVTEEGSVYNVRWRRTTAHKYRNGRPAVFSVVEKLLSPGIPRSVLVDLYRQNVRRVFGFEDSPSFHAFTLDWLSEVNASARSLQNRSTLLTLISPPQVAGRITAGGLPPERCLDWSAGLIEILESLAILQFTDQSYGGYWLKFKADPAFVQANIFGRSTGVEGLDYLFYGGVWVPDSPNRNRNCLMTVEGPAGAGKSITALSAALQACARGAYCLLLSFEVEEQAFISQAVQLCRHLVPFVSILDHQGRVLHEPEQGAAMGKLVISDISRVSPENLRAAAFEEALKEEALNYPERWIIFDSIGASSEFSQENAGWRRFLFETTATLRGFGYVVVVVLERERGAADSAADFLADVAIRFEHTAASADSYNVRTIEVAKTRFQRSHRGSHLYSLQSGTGLQVYPSSSAVLASRRRRESQLGITHRTSLDPGVEGFARYPGGVQSPVNNRVPFWLEGSTTVLYGPRGCMKRTFSNLFCKTLPEDQHFRPVALSMQFGGGLMGAGLPFTPDMWRSNPFGYRCDVPLESGPNAASSSYLMFRTGHVAPGHVLKVVGDLLLEKRRQQTRIRRVSITGLGGIETLFSLLKADEAFLPALCDMLASEGISILLDYSLPHHGDTDRIGEQVLSLADNIISFFKVPIGSQTSVRFNVDRSSDASHDIGIYELQPAPNGGLKVVPIENE